MQLARRFSVTNFFIATSALAFQVLVLYPWHQRLDDDFTSLQTQLKTLHSEHQLKQTTLLTELTALRKLREQELRDREKMMGSKMGWFGVR